MTPRSRTCGIVGAPVARSCRYPRAMRILGHGSRASAPSERIEARASGWASTAAALDRRIEELALRARRGEKVAIVWDADFTLFDPRPRMLATVRAFGCAGATLAEMHAGPDATARGLGLPVEAFRRFWSDHYWRPSSFAADLPVEALVARARRCQRLGIANIVVTGRRVALHGATAAQLRRAGVEARAIHCKDGGSTGVFKANTVLALVGQGYHLGAFVTDSPSELEALARVDVRRRVPGLLQVLCSVEGCERPAERIPMRVCVLAVP